MVASSFCDDRKSAFRIEYKAWTQETAQKLEMEISHHHNGMFHLRLQLHDAIYRPDSFVMMLRYYANLKAIRYESTSLNRIVADKSPRVIVT